VTIYAGTSGFSFKEWKGSFYPADLPASAMLSYYAERLPAVEINNTFYRMPKEDLLEGWAVQVPPGFRFVLKAPRRITHLKRLAGAADDVRYLYETAQVLGERLGPVLFQCPPNLKKDTERLREFLGSLPQAAPAAFEFRHASWLDDEVVEALNEHDCALCVSETDDDESAPPIRGDASWGYLRLRRTAYDESALAAWARAVAARSWRTAYVFFKHEEAGTGPALASRFLELCAR
jgi:uncharacterized protein YecE (DUF72 family)